MTLQDVLTALRNADAAGDVEAARRLAQIAQSMQTASSQYDSQIGDIDKRLAEMRGRKPEIETTIGGNIKEFGKGVVPGAIGLLETAGTGIASMLPDSTEKAAREKIKEIAGVAKKPFEAGAGYEDSVGRKLGEGLGSTLPFFLAGPLGLAGRVGAGGLGVAAGAGESRQRAEAEGATAEERRSATLLGAPTGLLDLLAPSIGPMKSIVTTAFARGGIEGATEAAQQIAQNLIAKGVYKPEQAVIEGAGEAGAYGAGVGGIASVILDLTLGRRARGARTTESEGTPAGTPPAGPTAERPQGELFPDELDAAMGPPRPATTGEPAGEPATAGRTAAEAGQMSLFGGDAGPSELETAQPDLFGEMLPAREQAAAVEEPVAERDTQTRDMIDELETTQIEEMQAEEQSAKLREELSVQKAEAKQQRLKMESDIAELDGKIKAKEQKTTEDKRLQLLLPIIESDVKNIPKAFVNTLKREGLTNTNLTDRERQLINRAYDVRLAEDVAPEQEAVIQQPAGQTKELEAQVPEKKAQREPEQMSFPGMGKPKGKAPEAFSEEELAAQEEKPFATKLTADVLVQTGLPKQSGFYKQLLDMDMADPAQQPAVANIFTRVRENANLSQTTKDAIERIAMQAFGGLSKQQELFAPGKKGGKKPTPKEKPSEPAADATGDDAKPDRVGAERGKASVRKAKPAGEPADTERTEAPKSAGLGDRGEPAGGAGDRKSVESGALKETKTTHRVTYDGKPATVTITRTAGDPTKIDAVTVKVDGEKFAAVNLGKQGVVSDEKMLNNLVETEVIESKTEPKAKTEKSKAKAAPGDNAYQTEYNAGNDDGAIRNLAADAYLNTAEDYSVKKAQQMIKDLEEGKVPDLKFGKNDSNGPGTGGKYAKEFYDALDAADKAKFVKEFQNFLYSEIKTKDFMEQFNRQQEIARDGISDMDLLSKDASKLATPLHPMAVRMLKDNNLVGALRFVAGQNLGRVSDIADRLAGVLGGVEVQVVDFQSKNPTGVLKQVLDATSDATTASGAYVTTKGGKRIILLDSNSGMDAWSLLHEATHGAANQTLNNTTHPLTKQLTQLFNDVKDSLDGAYGATDAKEFASEAFSNPAFQQKLASINPKGEKITAWQRFVHAVKNFLRSMVGMPTKGMGSALDSADYMIEAIVNGHPGTSASLQTVSLLNKGSEFFTAMGRRAESLPGLDREKVGSFHEFFAQSIPNTIKSIVRQSLPLNALVEVAQKYIPMAPKLDVMVGERAGAENKRNQAIEPVIDRVGTWAKNNPNLVDKLNNVIYRSTLDQVDPGKPRTEYVGKSDDSGNKKDEAWDEMQADWKALGPDGQSTYKLMRDTYKKLYEQVKTVLDTRIDSALEDAETRKKVKAEIYARLFNSGHIEPYFPLTRSGKYWLSYTLGNEFYVEAYETDYQRTQASKELKADGATDVQKFANLNQINYRKAPATSFVNNVLRTLEANKVDANVTEEVMRLFLNTLPETSFAQSFRRRKGTLGFQRDAVGALRTKAFNLSRQLSNMEYGAKLEKLRADMKEYVRSQGNPDEAVAMMNEFDARIDYAISPQVPRWSQLATSFGFNFTLGFNVSSAIVNMSQIPLVVMPYLGGKYGYSETTRALGRATKYFTNSGFKREVEMLVPTDKGEKTLNVRAFPSMDNYDFSKDDAPKHLKALIDVAGERGQLNRSQVYDILDVDERDSVLTKINAASGFVFHHGERMNRQVALIAAYELELQRILGAGRKFESATLEQQRKAADYAVYVTELTNGGTTAAAAPRIAQSGIGKVIFMYKRYGVSMYYMLFKTAREALKDADPQVRSAAKRQIAGIYASSALMAGAQGIPMFGVAAMVYNLILKDEDDEDFDTAARKYLGEGIYSGALNALTGVNVATRLGLSDLLFRDASTRPSDSVMLSLIEQLGGPVIGVTNRVIRGMELINDGNIERGIEQILPSAFGNGFKAVRFATEGANTLRGDPITGEIGPWNAFAQFFGFAPAEYTRQLEINASLKNIERKALEDRTKLLRKYYVASRVGDGQEAADLLAEMLKFNRKHPGAAITGQTIKNSMAQHMKTSQEMYHGITLSKSLRPQLLLNASEYDDE